MTRPTAHPDASTRPVSRGFSLVELMIAMAIFAIGSIAVASIFPVAILLQKATVADMRGDHFAASAEAMVKVRGFTAGVGSGVVTTANEVTPAPPALVDPTAVTSEWQLPDRSYNALLPFTSRKVFWVPLFFASNLSEPDTYSVYLFIVKAAADATYTKPALPSPATWANPDDPEVTDATYPAVPGVRSWEATVGGSPVTNRFDLGAGANNPRLIRAGEKILDQKGREWIVRATDDNGVVVDEIPESTGTPLKIWFAHPDDDAKYSSFVDLIQILHDPANDRLIK